MAKKVEAWKANDGSLHLTASDAVFHDLELDMMEWYIKNKLSTSYIDREDGETYNLDVSFDIVHKWLHDNRQMILKILDKRRDL